MYSVLSFACAHSYALKTLLLPLLFPHPSFTSFFLWMSTKSEKLKQADIIFFFISLWNKCVWKELWTPLTAPPSLCNEFTWFAGAPLLAFLCHETATLPEKISLPIQLHCWNPGLRLWTSSHLYSHVLGELIQSIVLRADDSQISISILELSSELRTHTAAYPTFSL